LRLRDASCARCCACCRRDDWRLGCSAAEAAAAAALRSAACRLRSSASCRALSRCCCCSSSCCRLASSACGECPATGSGHAWPRPCSTPAAGRQPSEQQQSQGGQVPGRCNR
jgi:hypothetical protein